ncbi:MAG: STAS domain-containing protein [Spirochaetaceae bacterium]|nr:MAG: STAS domain-containing protein [Spirochaetaceae bacterium]
MSSNVKVVNLTGSVTVSSVDALAGQIRDSVAEKEMVLLSLSQATEIDLAGVQLLYAARRYAVGQGKALHITGAVPMPVAQRLLRCGFTEELIQDGRALDEGLHGFSEGTVPDA